MLKNRNFRSTNDSYLLIDVDKESPIIFKMLNKITLKYKAFQDDTNTRRKYKARHRLISKTETDFAIL